MGLKAAVRVDVPALPSISPVCVTTGAGAVPPAGRAPVVMANGVTTDVELPVAEWVRSLSRASTR